MSTSATASSSANPSSSPRIALRSIGAVLAGLVTIFVVSTATDIVMHLTGVFPPMGAAPMSGGLFLLAFSYRFVFDVAGTALTARLAPRSAMRHAYVLGGIGFVLATIGTIAMWDAGPAWYSLGVTFSALPCAYLGGRLGARVGNA